MTTDYRLMTLERKTSLEEVVTSEQTVYLHIDPFSDCIPIGTAKFSGLVAVMGYDWHQQTKAIMQSLPFSDLILADEFGAGLLKANGFERTAITQWQGVNPGPQRPDSRVERDIDLLFVGDLDYNIAYERNRWLDRLAILSDGFNIVFLPPQPEDKLVELCQRTKIVFDSTLSGGISHLALVGASCGALVMLHSENTVGLSCLKPDVHCVTYSRDTLEDKFLQMLRDQKRRENIANSASKYVRREFSERKLFSSLCTLLRSNLEMAGKREAAAFSAEQEAEALVNQWTNCASYPEREILHRQIELTGSLWSELKKNAAKAYFIAKASIKLDIEARITELSHAINLLRDTCSNDEECICAPFSLATMLLERYLLSKSVQTDNISDLSEAAEHFNKAVERCETGWKYNDESMTGFVYTASDALMNLRLQKAWRTRDMTEGEWLNEMRTVITSSAYARLSDIALMQNNVDEALKYAYRSALITPEEADFLIRLAATEALTGRYEEAITHYREGLYLSPLRTTAWPELLKLLYLANKVDEAENYLEERQRVIRAIPSFEHMNKILESVRQELH